MTDHTSDSPAVSVTSLTKRYGTFTALDNLDLTLHAGHIVALMGENGSGKTTLLKVLAGLLADHDGDVRIFGERLGPATKAMVSFLPDASFLPDHITAETAIVIYRDFFADFDEAKARDLIGGFRLRTDQRLNQMSKGMREKLQIALAMSRNARVHLLDEPISGVDPAARSVILDGILSAFDPNALLVISTHLITDIEAIADQAVFVRDGRVLLQGDADDLRATHGAGLDEIFRKEYTCSPH